MTGSGVSIRGLDFRWQGRDVLRGLDLDLAPGTVTALRGPNGAGKTTLIRLLAGALVPSAGRIALGGIDATADRGAYVRRVGLATAGDRGLYARLTVRENLELAAGLALAGRRRGRVLTTAGLQRFDLGELADRRGDRLSLGQRQRVRLAMAFVAQPALILLDEPTSSLDPTGSELLAEALRDVASQGTVGLWASPAGELPTLPFDQLAVLTEGRVEVQR